MPWYPISLLSILILSSHLLPDLPHVFCPKVNPAKLSPVPHACPKTRPSHHINSIQCTIHYAVSSGLLSLATLCTLSVTDPVPAAAITLVCTVIYVFWHGALEDKIIWTGNIQHSLILISSCFLMNAISICSCRSQTSKLRDIFK